MFPIFQKKLDISCYIEIVFVSYCCMIYDCNNSYQIRDPVCTKSELQRIVRRHSDEDRNMGHCDIAMSQCLGRMIFHIVDLASGGGDEIVGGGRARIVVANSSSADYIIEREKARRGHRLIL